VVDATPLAEHERKLRVVSQRFRGHNLQLQPDKCQYLRKEDTFYGHKIPQYRTKPDAGKVDSFKNSPTPRITKQLTSFLGLAGYFQRFIPHISKTAAPLQECLKKDVKYIYKRDTEIVFHKLMLQRILEYSDFLKEFNLTSDTWNGE
jgi:hypothetical protein